MIVFLTGSNGLIGSSLVKYLDEKYYVIPMDFFNINLTDDFEVEEFFKSRVFPDIKGQKAALVNCFALNDQVKDAGSNLFNISLNSFRQYMETNVTALFSVCREFAKYNPVSSIVNFTSTYGLGSPHPNMYPEGREKHIAYGVSKAAVIQLTRHLAVYLAPNIRVNCIAPGGIENGQDLSFIEKYNQNVPLGRMGKVNEVSGLVEFLISDKSSYCTGGVYPVDGGWTAW